MPDQHIQTITQLSLHKNTEVEGKKTLSENVRIREIKENSERKSEGGKVRVNVLNRKREKK